MSSQLAAAKKIKARHCDDVLRATQSEQTALPKRTAASVPLATIGPANTCA